MPFLPFIPFPDCAEVVIKGVNSATAAYMTFMLRFGGAPTTGDLTAVGVAIAARVHSDFLPNMCNTYAAHEVQVTDLSSAFAPSVSVSVPTPQDGLVTTAAVSNQDALVMSLKTAKRGRSYRGRIYVPALPASARVNGTLWTTAVIAVWEVNWQDLVSDVTLLGWNLGVGSRQHDNVRRTVGEFNLVLGIIGKQPIGTQRRRIIGHGI